MKSHLPHIFHHLLVCVIAVSIASLMIPSEALQADEPQAKKSTEPASASKTLFDGKALKGWAGRVDLWSLEDGEIVGRTSDETPIKQNTFLIYQAEEFSNFELTLRFKIESGNSGIQYRSEIHEPMDFVISGYQADIDFANRFAGILYEEKGRGILATRGQSVTIGPKGKKTPENFGDAKALGNGIHPGEWNDFRIIADGNHLQHFINGAMTSEVIDEQPEKAAESGLIALQLHRGPAMTVRFKDIVLTPLP